MKIMLQKRTMNYRELQERRLRRKNRSGFRKVDISYTILLFALLFTIGIYNKNNPIHLPTAHADTTYISPLSKLEVTTTPTSTPIPTPIYTNQQQAIVSYIQQTFGTYSPRAMQLLGCENSSLNPDAINTAGNTPAGSQDIGIFQINDYWNNIGNVDMLEDPQVNIAVAWKKFKDSGYSFNQWTCGRELGI